MLENFQRAALDSVYCGSEPPYESFVLPAFLKDFCRELLARRADAYQPVRQICAFGGMFLDQKLGLKPKDYDIYISCPALVKQVADFYENTDPRSYDEDPFQSLVGHDFPVSLHEDSLHRERLLDFFGLSFGLVGNYHHNGQTYRMDITIGSKDVHLRDISLRSSAPVMSAAANIHPGQEFMFSYHKKFLEQAEARVMAVHKPADKQMIAKAKRKGLTIVGP